MQKCLVSLAAVLYDRGHAAEWETGHRVNDLGQVESRITGSVYVVFLPGFTAVVVFASFCREQRIFAIFNQYSCYSWFRFQ